MNLKTLKQSQAGNGILGVMVAASVIAIMATSLASLLTQMNVQQAIISQKLERSELKNMIMQTLVEPNKCSWQFANLRVDTTKANGTSPSPDLYYIDTFYARQDANSTVVAKTEAMVPGSLSALRVKYIRLRDLLSTGKPNEYTAILQTDFSTTSHNFPFAPVQNSLTLTTDPTDPADNARISNCSLGAPPVTGPTLAQVCASLGGQFDVNSQQCEIGGGGSSGGTAVAANNQGNGSSGSNKGPPSNVDMKDGVLDGNAGHGNNGKNK